MVSVDLPIALPSHRHTRSTPMAKGPWIWSWHLLHSNFKFALQAKKKKKKRGGGGELECCRYELGMCCLRQPQKKTNLQEAFFSFFFIHHQWCGFRTSRCRPPPPPPPLPPQTLRPLPSFSLTLSVCGSIRFTSNHFYSEGHPNVCQGFQVYLHNTVSALLAHFFLSLVSVYLNWGMLTVVQQ